jgi:hypothetical protein
MSDLSLAARKTTHMEQHTTFFSTREWADCWSRVFRNDHVLEISVLGSGPPRTMHLIKSQLSYGLVDLSSGFSSDFCVSPGWLDKLDESTVRLILNQLPWWRTRSFTWKVRFDHRALAHSLSKCNFTHRLIPVHILNLEPDYDRVFRHFSSTVRNEIRKSARRGVVVRSTTDPTDIETYQRIYSSLASIKAWTFIYPARLTSKLLRISNPAHFVVAEFEGILIGGALFVKDGNGVYYMHGVADRNFNHLYPARAVLAAGIKWACEIGADFVNFGNSGSRNSLALFKSFWGTHIENNCLFTWENPVWDRAARVRRRAWSMLSKSTQPNLALIP